MKKILAMLLIAMLSLGLTYALAEETPTVYTSGDWEYVLQEDGTAEITSYNGRETELTIPAELDGYAVTAIADSAFAFNRRLTIVTIPDSVTSIGDYAFSNCTSLTLTVGRDSYARQYAIDNGLSYTYPDSIDWLLN